MSKCACECTCSSMNARSLSQDHILKILSRLNPSDVGPYVGVFTLTSLREEIENDNPNAIQYIKCANILGSSLTYPLNFSIRNHNLECAVQCLKLGADIFYENKGETYIHFTTIEDNQIMLKYFISKGLDVNKQNGLGHTPAQMALGLGHYECYKILVENGAKMYNPGEKKKKVYHIEMMLSEYDSETDPGDMDDKDEVIEFILKKMDPMYSLTLFTNNSMRELIHKDFSIAKKIIYRFPNFANKVIDGETLLSLLIKGGKNNGKTLEILKLKSTNLDPPGIAITYLCRACYVGAIDVVKYLLENAPFLIDKKSHNGQIPIDFILGGYKNYTTEEAIDLIKLFIDKASDNKNMLNNRSNNGARVLERAIEFADPQIIGFLIDQGIGMNDKIINPVYNYHTQHSNNDPLSYACQMERTKIIKLLLKRGCVINLSDGVPIALLTSINYSCVESIYQLMKHQRIAEICSDQDIKKKLVNFCLNNTSNREIMNLWIDDNKLNTLQINQNSVLFNKIERFFENVVKNYQEIREDVMHTFYDVALFYEQLSRISDFEKVTSDSKKLRILNGIVSRYLDLICDMGQHKKIYEHCLLSLCFEKVYELEIIMRIFTDDVLSIVRMQNDCSLHTCPHGCPGEVSKTSLIDIWNNMVKLAHDIDLDHLTQRFTEILKIIDSKRNIKYIPLDQIPEYTLHSETDTEYIQKVLVPLEYPVKVPHYDDMYARLNGLNCTMSETPGHIIVNDNVTDITSIIFNTGPYKPKRWFKYYKYNIGKESKDDNLHLFPFILDKKLKDVNCHQKSIYDRVNQQGSVTLVSFLGMLKYKKEFILGVYEYYIDSMGSLFHRFFKPHEQLPDKMKHELGVSTKTQIKEKFELAKELIKHF